MALIYGYPAYTSIGYGYGCWQFFLLGMAGLAVTVVLYRQTESCIFKMVQIWTRGEGTNPLALYKTISEMPPKYVTVEESGWWKNNFLYYNWSSAPANVPPPNITEEIIARCFPGRSIEGMMQLMDMIQLWNCFLLGLYLMEFIHNAIANKTVWWIFLMPLPSLLTVFYWGPLIIRHLALLKSVACMDNSMLSKTFRYMNERDVLLGMLRFEIRTKMHERYNESCGVCVCVVLRMCDAAKN